MLEVNYEMFSLQKPASLTKLQQQRSHRNCQADEWSQGFLCWPHHSYALLQSSDTLAYFSFELQWLVTCEMNTDQMSGCWSDIAAASVHALEVSLHRLLHVQLWVLSSSSSWRCWYVHGLQCLCGIVHLLPMQNCDWVEWWTVCAWTAYSNPVCKEQGTVMSI